MELEYLFANLLDEMAGVKIEARKSFSAALKRTLGEEEAVRWYFHTKVPELGSQTPHNYVEIKRIPNFMHPTVRFALSAASCEVLHSVQDGIVKNLRFLNASRTRSSLSL